MTDEFHSLFRSAAHWCHLKPLSLDLFPRDRHACRQYKKTCPYMALCSAPVSSWVTILTESGLFVKGEPPLQAALKGHSSLTEGVTEDV